MIFAGMPLKSAAAARPASVGSIVFLQAKQYNTRIGFGAKFGTAK
jgi:hypothetical protein